MFIALLAAGLFFAVGGGGGTNPTMALEQKFSCPGNILLITASSINGPLPGVSLEVSRFDRSGVLKRAETDSEGHASFKLDEDGAYKISGSKSGYSNSDLLATFKACKVESNDTVFCDDGALRDRVRCIMNLPDDDVLKVRYIPEECRAGEAGSRNRCIATYRMLQTCRIGIEDDGAREACIKPKLNLSANISDDMARCGKDAECLGTVREDVFTLVKFRMYNLVYKAEEMKKLGVPEDQVIEFVAFLEDAKVRFNRALSIADKKAIVMEVKARWDEFRSKAESEIGVGI